MRALATWLAVLALVAAVAVDWAMPRPLGDLYLALSAGRDVLDGKLGNPDDWSFTTHGRVWVNPSWISGVLLFLAEGSGGDVGLLAVKALLLGGLAVLVTRACRARGATWLGALLAGALALGASPQEFMLRPNLVSFLCLPVLFLLLSRPVRRSWTWGVLGLLGLWANLHGGFVFGLLVLGLWTAADLAAGRSPAPETERRWLVPAVFLGAVVVTAFANPFGWSNLAQQFTVIRSEAWKQVVEWKPLFGPRPAGVAMPWLFLGMSALVVGIGLVRALLFMKQRGGARDVGSRRRIVFDVLLVASVLALALISRRLVPWAALAMAPLTALDLDFLLRSRRAAIPAIGVGCVILGAIVVPQHWIPAHYDPKNPHFPKESVFDRMILHGTQFPGGAARFLAENEVRARAFHEWRWEGYLRWSCPGVALYLGGRAQQVYDESTYFERREILGDPEALARLRALGVSLIVVPLTFEYGPLCQRLLVGEEATWVYVYADRYTAVLADGSHADTQDLASRAGDGSLWYPDSACAALSRGLWLASPASASPPGAAVPFLVQALVLRPTGYVYPILVKQALASGVPPEEVLEFLEGERARLSALGADQAEAIAILDARLYMGREIQRLYPPDATVERRRLITELQEVRDEIKRMNAAYPAFMRSEPLPAVRRPGSPEPAPTGG